MASQEELEDDFPNDPLFEMSIELDSLVIPETTPQATPHVDGTKEQESEDSGSADYAQGLPGTTPPTHGRFIKMARKGHKHRPAKKLSMGNIPMTNYSSREKPELKKRPLSMITIPSNDVEDEATHQRRHTVHEVKVHHRKERRHKGGSGDSGGEPHQSDDKISKKKRKQEARKRKKDRDEKVSRQEQPRVSFVRTAEPVTQSIDVPDLGGRLPLTGSDESFLMSSLQPHLFRSDRSYSGISQRGSVRRAKSDISLVSTGSEERQSIHCPPERKQFYRHFIRALKYSGISAAAHSRMESSPPGVHVARQYSENLALGNPYGHMYDQIWLELQAFLSDKTPEAYQEWLFYKKDHVDRILNRIINFELPLHDPLRSLNSLFFAAPDYNREGYEPMNTPGSTSLESVSKNGGITPVNADNKTPKVATTTTQTSQLGAEATTQISQQDSVESKSKVATTTTQISQQDSVESKSKVATTTTQTSQLGAEATTQISQQDSVESKSSGESINLQCPSEQFLSQLQLLAMSRVDTLLTELDSVETLYPTRQKMGDELPNYRTLVFKRRVEALILWLKVTNGIAKKLSSLSTWLGVRVVIPAVCTEGSRSRTTSFDKPGSPRRARTQSDPLAPGSPKSPKSPTVKLQFSVGSPGSEINPQQSLMPRRLKRLNSSFSRTQSSSGSSYSQATLQRLFSNYQSASFDETHGPYRAFVDRGLKKKGLTRLMKILIDSITPVLTLAQDAMTPLSERSDDTDEFEEERRPLLRAFLPPALTMADCYHPRTTEGGQFRRTTSVGPDNWTQEFEAMNLPLFYSQYIQLVHVPLDVMHECLRMQLELRPPRQPSAHSVKQLVRECRETLERAIYIRQFYRGKIDVVVRGDPFKQEQVENDLEMFEDDLRAVLEIYFDYLQSWVQVSSGHVLEEEWKHVKEMCTHIRGGEADAGRRFCDMASRLLESTADILESRMDECCRILHKSGDCLEKRRAAIGESCRSFKELFVEIRERASKALGFAKMLRKPRSQAYRLFSSRSRKKSDLEIAADFMVQVPARDLLDILQASDHVQVVLPNQTGKMMFVPENTGESVEEIHQLLNVSFAHSDQHHFDPKDSYLLLVTFGPTDSLATWNGRSIDIKASAEAIIAISEIQVESLKMVVSNSSNLSSCRNSFLSAVANAVKLTSERTSSHQNVAERISDLKMAACELAKNLMHAAVQVTEHLSMEDTSSAEEVSKPYQGTMLACFNLGFEYIREVFRLLGDDMAYQELGDDIMDYAQLWMRFVVEKCDRGRGTRPRWAMTGLDFLIVACAPHTLATISYTKFEAVKKLMNRCLDHVVGEARPHPTSTHPSKFAGSNRKSWRKPSKTPKLVHGSRAYSTPITRVEEEDVPVYHQPFCEEVIRVEEAPAPLYQHMVDTPMVAKLDQESLLAVYPGALPDISPPVSAGSLESISSGHDSPPIFTGDITNVMPFVPFSTPVSTPRHPPSTLPSMERVDSNTSTCSASGFYSSVSRTPSSASFSSQDSFCVSDKMRQVQEQIKLMEKNRDDKLFREKVIGKVTEKQHSSLHEVARLSNLKQSHFRWQRGRKLGEGRFGKVYECFNLDTGEINAVKQISIQEKDTSAIETIIDEISLFQKLTHPNIVKFYGVEVHRNELYMFMEYCNEGTLWSIAQQGLTEHMIRQYTRDILNAVYALHDRGIVHRDVKGANIFLSSNGSIKLGDFGLSVQLKNFHKTMPNELKQQVGTVPYMSPEAILKHEMGRPVDIWSVGCVVIEMATGKLPWSECDNQFQIMYKLGSGECPPIPKDALSPEGIEFLSHCFEKDPSRRWKANRLLDHPFVKVSGRDSSEEG